MSSLNLRLGPCSHPVVHCDPFLFVKPTTATPPLHTVGDYYLLVTWTVRIFPLHPWLPKKFWSFHQGNWPSENVLAHFCLSQANKFRSNKVIELGSGYGLAAFVIAAVTEASEVVISDGNPLVVNYTQCNIEANSSAFGDTIVKSMLLHWDKEDNVADTFDIIVASDCTFFKDFHEGLVHIVKKLLSKSGTSEAILSPKRSDSLDLFLRAVEENGLHFNVTENYDTEVWKRYERFLNGEDKDSWPSYEKVHCYPLLIRITL